MITDTDSIHGVGRRLSRTRDSKDKEQQRRFFIISEGMKTEPMYFQMIRDNLIKLGVDRHTIVVPVWRCIPDSGCSDWEKILDLTDMYVKEMKFRKHTSELYASEYADKLSKRMDMDQEEVVKVAKELLSVLEPLKDEYGTLNDDDAERECTKYVSNKFGTEVHLTISDIEDHKPKDVISVFIDRDKRKGDEKDKIKIGSYVNRCLDSGYVPYVTNPCFELWLLLHYGECNENTSCRSLKNELEVKHGYNKKNPNFETYLNLSWTV